MCSSFSEEQNIKIKNRRKHKLDLSKDDLDLLGDPEVEDTLARKHKLDLSKDDLDHLGDPEVEDTLALMRIWKMLLNHYILHLHAPSNYVSKHYL